MNWDANYELGLEEIDQQHRFLFERIRMIESAIVIGGPANFVCAVIAELEHYATVHFATEEEIFDRHAYPRAEEHRCEHRQFVSVIERIKLAHEADEAGAKDDLLGYLREWFATHILVSDFAYGRFLKSR